MICENKIIDIPDCNDADKVARVNAFIKEVFAKPEKEQPNIYLEPESGNYEASGDSISEKRLRHQKQWDKRTLRKKLEGIWNDEHRPLTGRLKLNLFKSRTAGGKSKRKNKKRSKKTRKGRLRKN